LEELLRLRDTAAEHEIADMRRAGNLVANALATLAIFDDLGAPLRQDDFAEVNAGDPRDLDVEVIVRKWIPGASRHR
jgi:hypothetical protein